MTCLKSVTSGRSGTTHFRYILDLPVNFSKQNHTNCCLFVCFTGRLGPDVTRLKQDVLPDL